VIDEKIASMDAFVRIIGRPAEVNGRVKGKSCDSTNLEEVHSLGWVLQQTLDQCDERGLCSLHLCVPELQDQREEGP